MTGLAAMKRDWGGVHVGRCKRLVADAAANRRAILAVWESDKTAVYRQRDLVAKTKLHRKSVARALAVLMRHGSVRAETIGRERFFAFVEVAA